MSTPDPLLQQAVYYDKYRQWLAKLMGKDPEKFGREEVQVL